MKIKFNSNISDILYMFVVNINDYMLYYSVQCLKAKRRLGNIFLTCMCRVKCHDKVIASNAFMK